jgi:hypothetical protein
VVTPGRCSAITGKGSSSTVSFAGTEPNEAVLLSVRSRKLQRCSAQTSEPPVMEVAFIGTGRMATAPLPASSHRSAAKAGTESPNDKASRRPA